MKPEIYISVDIEASGPIPGEYSMLSLGAAVVGSISKRFYAELKPITPNHVPKAVEICGLSLEKLMKEGEEPGAAMSRFEQWIKEMAGEAKPVFVGFNATFDWGFVNYYFHRFLGRNPFGISGLDIKAYYMGMKGCSWGETAKARMDKEFLSGKKHTHKAVDDAVEQAEIMEKLFKNNNSQTDKKGL
ncbi:3'-5' exonuclease [Candidatus Woesearchaeota archaeon]|nr:3'-5' exonuclease [Candidatus Woesearchaeota archaeon]